MTRLALFTLLIALSARAATVYDYTGADGLCTDLPTDPQFTAPCQLTGTMTLSSALPADLNLYPAHDDIGGLIESVDFSFSGGDDLRVVNFAYVYSTDSQGDITAWIMQFLDPDIDYFVQTTDGGGEANVDNEYPEYGGGSTAQTASPGSWTIESAAPEPASAILLLPGIMALLAAARRRPTR